MARRPNTIIFPFTEKHRALNVGSVLPSSGELSSPRRNGGTVTLHELAKGSDDENGDDCQETSTSVKGMNELKSTTSMSVETKEKNSPLDLGNQCQTHMLRSWSPPQPVSTFSESHCCSNF